MPKPLTEDEANEVLEQMRNKWGSRVLDKYNKKGYTSFSQLEREVIRITGQTWRERDKEEIEFIKRGLEYD